MPEITTIKDQMAYLGHENYGLQPFSVKKTEKTISCENSYETILTSIVICFILAPYTFYEYSKDPNSLERFPFLDRFPFLILIAVGILFLYGLYKIFTFLFRKRKIVFNGNDLSIELIKGKMVNRKILRKEIKAFEITSGEREQKSTRMGTFRWTAHILFIVLENGKRMYLLEAEREEQIKEIKSEVIKLFDKF